MPASISSIAPRALSLLAAVVAASVAGGCAVGSYASPTGPRFAGAASAPTPDPEPAVRVVSFNIQFSVHVDRAIEQLRSDETLRDADVLLLQEMNAEGAAAIADALGFHHVYYPATRRGTEGYGNAVVSRWPIVEDHKILLPHLSPENGQRRAAVAALLDTPFGRMAAVSVHAETVFLPLQGRIEQLAAVLRDVEAHYGTSGIPVVVGGDFNTPEEWGAEQVRGLFTMHGFRHATRRIGPTADYFFFQRVMNDYVFVRDLNVESAGVEETHASDHGPVYVELSPPDR
jgi:endonuclease/exonuclease/phosphatase family metal-dependent hydrolase